jgi:hypothetical protein
VGRGVGYLDLFFCLWSSRGEIYLTKGRLYKKQKQKTTEGDGSFSVSIPSKGNEVKASYGIKLHKR